MLVTTNQTAQSLNPEDHSLNLLCRENSDLILNANSSDMKLKNTPVLSKENEILEFDNYISVIQNIR